MGERIWPVRQPAKSERSAGRVVNGAAASPLSSLQAVQAADVAWGLQRSVGNRLTVRMLAGQATSDRRSGPGRVALHRRQLQRRLGLEVEVATKAELTGRVPTGGTPDWEKRDVLYKGTGWTVTLDDTPGGIRDNGDKGTFNLEFILGGSTGKGFEDNEVSQLKAAIAEMNDWFALNQGEKTYTQTADGANRNGTLTVKVPPEPPPSANVQLTSGLALTGLYSMISEAHQDRLAEHGDIDAMDMPAAGALGSLVEGARQQKQLLKQFVSADEVALALAKSGTPPPGSGPADPAPRALAGMLTLIKTFAANASSQSANIKEATPILWKTPLHKFFEDPALSGYPVAAVWRPLADSILGDLMEKSLSHPPTGPHKQTFTVKQWMYGLTEQGNPHDLLYDLDQHYDKSIGGIGRLEGGTGTSRGHPIFEFRAFPNSWAGLVETVNGLPRTGQRPSNITKAIGTLANRNT